jgi:hypothetical protein
VHVCQLSCARKALIRITFGRIDLSVKLVANVRKQLRQLVVAQRGEIARQLYALTLFLHL